MQQQQQQQKTCRKIKQEADGGLLVVCKQLLFCASCSTFEEVQFIWILMKWNEVNSFFDAFIEDIWHGTCYVTVMLSQNKRHVVDVLYRLMRHHSVHWIHWPYSQVAQTTELRSKRKKKKKGKAIRSFQTEKRKTRERERLNPFGVMLPKEEFWVKTRSLELRHVILNSCQILINLYIVSH